MEQAVDREPGPEARYTSVEAIELAFVAALQHLRPQQTAAFVLCDVLGYPQWRSPRCWTPTRRRSKALQRARAGLRRHRDTIAAQQAPLPGSAEERKLTKRFAETFVTGDIDGLVDLLTDDAWLAMPPAPHEYHGHAAIAQFLATFHTRRAGRRLRLPTRANGRLAFGCYLAEPDRPTARPAGILVLGPSNDRRDVTWFLHGDLLRHSLLPVHVTA